MSYKCFVFAGLAFCSITFDLLCHTVHVVCLSPISSSEHPFSEISLLSEITVALSSENTAVSSSWHCAFLNAEGRERYTRRQGDISRSGFTVLGFVRPTRDNKLNSCPAELFQLYFSSFEAGIANAITNFK